MEHTGCSSGMSSKKGKGPAVSRRYWTPQEEEALINALKALRSTGWKCDGTFRGGYMVRLESMIAEMFPTAGLSVNHIRSKLTVWKKNYGLVLGILGSSGGAGASFDPSTMMIITDSESIWDDYIKVHRDASTIRGKMLPWFNSWVEIFGNDRAQGTGAVDVGDAVHDLIYGSQHNREFANSTPGLSGNAATGLRNSEDEPFDDATSNTPPTVNKQTTESKSSSSLGKRKKLVKPSLHIIQDMMGKFMEDTSSTLGNFASQLTRSTNKNKTKMSPASSTDGELYTTVSNMVGLTMDDQIIAAHRLATNPNEAALFLQMPNEARYRFIQLMLQGKLPSAK